MQQQQTDGMERCDWGWVLQIHFECSEEGKHDPKEKIWGDTAEDQVKELTRAQMYLGKTKSKVQW